MESIHPFSFFPSILSDLIIKTITLRHSETINNFLKNQDDAERKLKEALKKSKQEDSNQNLFCFQCLFGSYEQCKSFLACMNTNAIGR